MRTRKAAKAGCIAVIDGLGRNIRYLRVSVTDRCNLRCSYCMPREGVPNIPHGDILSFEEILRLCGIFAGLGVSRVKVTGGEPLVRRGVVDFVAALKRVHGIEQVTMTSNGTLLRQNAEKLRQAGLDGINISLDTPDAGKFSELAGFDKLSDTLMGIDAAAASKIPIKLNCVPLQSAGADEAVKIAGFAKDKVAAVRFIELMPIGCAQEMGALPLSEVRAALEDRFGGLKPCGEALGNGPAVYFSLPGFNGKIGFIGALEHMFCEDCNRVRLTSDGKLKLCLARGDGIDLRGLLRSGAADNDILEAVTAALRNKPESHDFLEKAADINMSALGG